MTVLVGAASRHGSTHDIAHAIGRVLAEREVAADVRDLEQAVDVGAYDAFVLGSAVYMGHWLDAARSFVGEHAEELATRPTWLFSSGPIGDPPRPSADDAVQVADLLEQTGAKEHRLFGGKLDRSVLGFGERALVVAFRVPEGDFRDWDEIETWAGSIAGVLRR